MEINIEQKVDEQALSNPRKKGDFTDLYSTNLIQKYSEL